MAQPRATTLFHFTKSLDVLQSILKSSFVPRFSLEDVTWLGITQLEYFAFPMVCFCDIPLGRIDEHVDFYGGYGLGLSREWAVKSGLNPIFYLSRSSPLGASFLSALRAAIKADKAKKKEERTSPSLHVIMAHMKPLSGNMVIGGKPASKDFYLENEWRFVPRIEGMPLALTKELYDDDSKRNTFNDTLGTKALLGFSPDDIRYIFVKADADIPPLVDFMNSQLGHLSVTAMKILTTRITSLEHIEKDI
jgi:hypothetical protein